MKKAYISVLAPFIKAFIEFKQSIGAQYETEAYYLHQFDCYYEASKTNENTLKDIFKNWVVLRDNECAITQHRRVAPIREFGKFLHASEYPDSYIIPNKVCQKQIRSMPHFFTNDEIVRFFSACDAIQPRKNYLGKDLVLPMLYRLLYCCGLRTCEARLLMRINVNIEAGYIDILNSKGPKDRRVFMSDDLRKLYEIYDMKINDIFPERAYFFPVNIDSGYSKASVSNNFNIIWEAAGIGHHSGKKARAYDFRHHVAFSNLNRWVEEGVDVNSMLPYLMRYMGHATFESLSYYLHLVPEFFPTFNDKTKILENLLPEVSYEKDD